MFGAGEVEGWMRGLDGVVEAAQSVVTGLEGHQQQQQHQQASSSKKLILKPSKLVNILDVKRWLAQEVVNVRAEWVKSVGWMIGRSGEGAGMDSAGDVRMD